jgi:von Willebrand factor type A domain
MKHFANPSRVLSVSQRIDANRKAVPWMAVLCGLALAAAAPGSCRAAENDGVALAILYDTSGSMRQPVRDTNGHPQPKYVIANRALEDIARQLEDFAKNTAGGSPRKVEAGLFTFNSSGQGAKEVVKFGPLDTEALRSWAGNFSHPEGSTPLGNALKAASRVVLASSLPHKHVLIITDGENNVGPDPASVLPRLQRDAQQKQTSLSVHFVAFDVDAKVFDRVKRLGATVVGAADEKQLDTQLQFILQRKILLEEEEPPKPAK